MKFLSELKNIAESEVRNVVFKLTIPSKASALLDLSKSDQMAAIEGEEEGDGSFIQNQSVITVEYITRKGNEIHVYPMLETLKSNEVSGLGARLQKEFDRWAINFKPKELDESVVTESQEAEANVLAVFNDIGEELLNMSSVLNYTFDKHVAALEAKHEVYLGEDLRSLKQLIKMATDTSKRLVEAVNDLNSDRG